MEKKKKKVSGGKERREKGKREGEGEGGVHAQIWKHTHTDIYISIYSCRNMHIEMYI